MSAPKRAAAPQTFAELGSAFALLEPLPASEEAASGAASTTRSQVRPRSASPVAARRVRTRRSPPSVIWSDGESSSYQSEVRQAAASGATLETPGQSSPASPTIIETPDQSSPASPSLAEPTDGVVMAAWGVVFAVDNLPTAPEYQSARERPLRNDAEFAEGEGASFAKLLEGHDVGDMFLNWQPAAPRSPAETVCYNVMEEEKWWRSRWKNEGEYSIATQSIRTSLAKRKKTSNWTPHDRVGGSQRRHIQWSEIEAIFKDHEGETRVWQLFPEEWVPLRSAAILATGPSGMGQEYRGTCVGKDRAARGALFEASEPRRFSGQRDVVEFGPYRRIDDAESAGIEDGGPDLDNAVSTLVVRAHESSRAGAPKYWVRKVRVISLPEVFYNYQHDVDFEDIYSMWHEGAVVTRKRQTRGRPSSSGSRRAWQRQPKFAASGAAERRPAARQRWW